ncbi:SOS response-associated peptidase family protein (plasmid) [Kosakonia sp. ML.JS2a]|uniref:SOS response-associated peptidase family protein n=1 Tax=Kosakonia sp. ML.JS2a TaxID=2980557 RepID=UPI0021DAA92F|nr:SOS response-associated peptidase family protein [Kosakonia sp. ML.JS2a]UXY13544.1 SOS response-associated peptidase family protein [Kosakonia sp. ML.JS2a]
MCGRFAQFSSRDEYLQFLNISGDTVPYDPQPLDRYNVAPGTRVLILSEQEGNCSLDPVVWGYRPEWWGKPPLINSRSETAATGKMFSKLWRTGRAIVPANGWFEWKKSGSRKQPYYIYRSDGRPLFMAAIGHAPFNSDHGHEGFVIVTTSSNQGMVDIHDRRPLVFDAEVARIWINESTTPEEAACLADKKALAESAFRWHPVSARVGNPHNQGKEIINKIDEPLT